MATKKQNTPKNGKRELDWQAVYDSIASAKLALNTVGEVSEEERERVWKERAKQFSQAPEEEITGEIAHLAIVRLGRELCGFEVSCIESIRPVEEVTRVPRAPNWLAGIANLRGHIYTVTDLQKFLHLNNGTQSEFRKGELLLVKTKKMRLALRVDEVSSVEMVQESRITPASDTIHGVNPEFIRGVIDDYQVNNEKVPVLVLNIDTLLADESLIVHEEFA